MIRSFAAAVLALTFVWSALLPARAASTRASSCWGQMTVSPGRVAVGSMLVLRGRNYHCSGPAGFLPRATVMFYQPGYGFAMFTIRPHRDGTYQQQVTIPRRMRAMADINGGVNRMVPTRPGRYYFWITLFDVSVAPASQAIASLTVVPGTAPNMKHIAAVMARTVEARNRGVHFVPVELPVTVADGRGQGALSAIVGTRSPADGGTGQLTFFWFNQRFLGWDSRFETGRIVKLAAPAAGTFRITYGRYAATDRPCCPSLPPVVVQSGWSGTMLISNGAPPPLTPKVKVVLLPAS